jgi:ABC-type dipeptide/oligopeptide/nickel transport system ATPase component
MATYRITQGPKWRGAFATVNSTDSFHPLGDAPTIGIGAYSGDRMPFAIRWLVMNGEISICVCGNSGSGKSSLVRRFVQNLYGHRPGVQESNIYAEGKTIWMEDSHVKIVVTDLVDTPSAGAIDKHDDAFWVIFPFSMFPKKDQTTPLNIQSTRTRTAGSCGWFALMLMGGHISSTHTHKKRSPTRLRTMSQQSQTATTTDLIRFLPATVMLYFWCLMRQIGRTMNSAKASDIISPCKHAVMTSPPTTQSLK